MTLTATDRSVLMADDDPRHGTTAGYNAHYELQSPICGPCRLAKRRYDKRRIMRGGQLKVSSLGARRRIQALQALGYSRRDIAEAAGYGRAHAALKWALDGDAITAATALRIYTAYDGLCMTLATNPRAERVRKHAAARGWPPPLAWTDIDDPAEQPTDWHYREDRRALVSELLNDGHGISEVLRRLDMSRNSFHIWCSRHDMTAEYLALVSREYGAGGVNQHTFEAAS